MEYKAKVIEKLVDEMELFYGNHLGTYHEIVTEGDYHIDVEVFKSKIDTEEFYTLVTVGMSQYTMKDAVDGYSNIELMFCMPITWDYNKDVWPINFLKMVAKMPSSYNWTIGPFHTIDLNGIEIANKFKHIFIEFPRNFSPSETTFEIKKNIVRVLQVYPIYEDELKEIHNENEAVMDKIVENTIFDENRGSVV